MTAAIHDFRSIRRKLERQEQKAEFEEKTSEPVVVSGMRPWPAGAACPMAEDVPTASIIRGAKLLDELYGKTVSLKSKAHPEWPYAGTPFEWSKFVKVKI